jgi:hypothetical protein
LSNGPGGNEIAVHDYPAAIATASTVGVGMDSTTALIGATNLCVAYTLTKAFREAVESCDAAEELRRRRNAISSISRARLSIVGTDGARRARHAVTYPSAAPGGFGRGRRMRAKTLSVG